MPAAQDHDIFMLREILHDWDDDDVLEILKSCRLSIGTKNAKLVFVEVRCLLMHLSKLVLQPGYVYAYTNVQPMH